MRCDISRDEAVARLREEIAKLDENDLSEVCRELFIHPCSNGGSKPDVESVRHQIFARFDQGLVGEELEDTWNVVFPAHRRVHFDSESERLTYVAP